jgi:hypothetical protein
MTKILVLVECLVECLVEWAAWVAWAEWACKPKNPIQKFKNAREIKHSGVFFYF